MLHQKLKDYHIILASGSPRRQAFLKELNVDFEVRLKPVLETYPEELTKEEITDYLAKLKAEPFKKELRHKDLLITSDTIVWFQNKAMGKPKDYQQAFDMLKKMSGNTHSVITSVCITNTKFTKVFNDVTYVDFKELSDQEIHYYVENYQPYDKAGGYGIQEWIGKIGIKRIEGSYFNVVGLPVYKLYEELMNL